MNVPPWFFPLLAAQLLIVLLWREMIAPDARASGAAAVETSQTTTTAKRPQSTPLSQLQEDVSYLRKSHAQLAGAVDGVNSRLADLVKLLNESTHAAANTNAPLATTARPSFSIPSAAEIRQSVLPRILDCYRTYQSVPTWFALPRVKAVARGANKTQTWALYVPPREPTAPTYLFSDERAYMRDYAASRFAYTWKKAGWDCMRHVEILGAGTIPVFVNIQLRPRCALVGYPFELLADIINTLNASLPTGSDLLAKPALKRFAQEQQWSAALDAHFRATLTCGAMVETLALFWQTHVLNATASTPQRVLFVDCSLPRLADYVSMMALIGLHEAWEQSARVDVVYRPPYLFDDWTGDPLALYGKGFNYVRCIAAALPPTC